MPIRTAWPTRRTLLIFRGRNRSSQAPAPERFGRSSAHISVAGAVPGFRDLLGFGVVVRDRADSAPTAGNRRAATAGLADCGRWPVRAGLCRENRMDTPLPSRRGCRHSQERTRRCGRDDEGGEQPGKIAPAFTRPTRREEGACRSVRARNNKAGQKKSKRVGVVIFRQSLTLFSRRPSAVPSPPRPARCSSA